MSDDREEVLNILVLYENLQKSVSCYNYISPENLLNSSVLFDTIKIV